MTKIFNVDIHQIEKTLLFDYLTNEQNDFTNDQCFYLILMINISELIHHAVF
jgi:hypothetical protein